MIRINVNLVTATVQETEVLTSGRVGLQCAFDFSEEWDGLTKVATFEGAESADVAMLSGNVVTVPHECMSSPGAKLRVGVCGMNEAGDIVIPTIWANAGRIQQGAEPSGIPAEEPSPNWAAQVQEAAASALEIARGVKNEADSGGFDGADGVSPTAVVSKTGTVTTVTITDRNGTTTASINDGTQGVQGESGPSGSNTWVSTVKPNPVEHEVYEDDPDYQRLTGGEFATSGLKGRTGQAPQVGDIISYPGSYDSDDEWDTQYSGLYVISYVHSTSVWGDYKGDIIGPKGDAGDTGTAATVTTGTTTTLAPGSYATVTNTGTSSAAVLNFGIPKGEKGDTGAAATDAQVQDAVDDWLDDHSASIDGLSFTAKNALMACFRNVAWKSDQGQSYFDALYNALFEGVELSSITAVFTQGANVIYDLDSLDHLKQFLVVSAVFSDSTTAPVQDSEYTLSGTLTTGTSTITATYLGKTATFTVSVTHANVGRDYQEVEYIQNAPTSQTNSSYFNTGKTFSGTGTVQIGIKFTPMTPSGWTASGSSAWIGVGCKQYNTGSSNYNGVFVGLRAGADLVTVFGGSHCGLSTSSILGQTFELTATHNSSGSTITDGVESNSVSYTTRSYKSQPICVFAIKYATKSQHESAFNGRIYYVNVSENGTDLLNLYPCYRRSDNKIGFYNRLTKEFLLPTSQTTLSVGPDV